MSSTFATVPRGPFSLAEAAQFGFGQRLNPEWDGILRLAFCLDGYEQQVGVEVRQDEDQTVHCVVRGDADLDRVRRQVARVLSLDHDGEGFLAVGKRDPVIGRLQQAAPGLRPPQFYSPYEAAAWAVLSARRPARQMGEVRQRLSEAHGAAFILAGRRLAAFPTPARLLQVEEFPGIPPIKISRLHAVARAAQAGTLDVERIQAVEPEVAMTLLQRLPGIGPFYSSLVVVRGSGLADVVVTEPKALALAAELYRLPALPREAQFRELTEPWRPFRTWAIVLIRAAAGRLLTPAPAGSRIPSHHS